MTPDPRSGCFTLAQADREAVLFPALRELTAHHYRHCAGYARILDATGGWSDSGRGHRNLGDLPWLPVRLFKNHVLKSIPDEEVFTVVTSSGTTGQPSRVHLDRQAAAAQQAALASVLRTAIGPRRLPMLIVDSGATVARAATVSARRAGVLGMMAYGRDYTFLLDADGELDRPAARAFLAAHGRAPFLVFGFTFLVWSALAAFAAEEDLDLSQGVLVHTGGWKKLADLAVDNDEFRRHFARFGLRRIHNFYGMAEQIGTVFLEGTRMPGLYCPDFADVVIRDPDTWREAAVGTPGLIQVVSTLPRSYPGHSLLTEDLGVVHGVDDGDWPGKRFSILGRLPRAEARGCSDAVGG
ncbi:acyl-protein synthetase [Actinospica durhamensis]|uniref:Acyl-protein synthetase n=1 Tax=Actinospica durhamensis TaxID=1508375 RepID=A0A941EFP4_9ACTN|nr:hypothetical protein [Actinospica durhamensis]MBR7831785.1 acyl-protein synthetase [Actinospica durhamensis]